MATFTISSDTNIDTLTSKAGNDTYNVNGAVFTIDQDSRYGANQTTSAALGNITVSSTLGGTVNIDGTKVRLIPFDTGSGNVPAANTVISQGSASGKLIGVWSALTSAPTAAGAAMPASGYIKIKQWNDVAYSAGALTGIGANATGADIVGWLEIVGVETKTMNIPRLGFLNITGAFYELGTTSGSANQTIQLPTSGSNIWFSGIYIEKTVGAGDFEFWPNAGGSTAIGTDEYRGKVVWIDNTGLVRIGNNGTTTAGYTPASGKRMVIGNIFLQNCTSGTLTNNCVPNTAAIADRYDFSTNAGKITIDKADMAWHFYITRPYSIDCDYLGVLDRLYLSTVIENVNLYRCGLGQSGTYGPGYTYMFQILIVYGTCSVVECVSTVGGYSAGVGAMGFQTITDLTLTDAKALILAARGGAINACYMTNLTNGTADGTLCVGGRLALNASTGVTLKDTTYCDTIGSTTGTTNGLDVFYLTSCTGCTVQGLSLPVENNHPYSDIINTSSCTECIIHSMGTKASPLPMGSVNKCASIVAGGTNLSCKYKRIWVDSVRTGTMYTTSSVNDFAIVESVGSIDYSGTCNINSSNAISKGLQYSTITMNAEYYGYHFQDNFTSTTAGTVAISSSEKTNWSDAHYTLTGAETPNVLPDIGDTITYEWPYYVKGHTGFANTALTLTGSSAAYYDFEYQIDKNDGNGFCADWRDLNDGATISAETSIDPALGFKLKVRVTTVTGNSSAWTRITIPTTSSEAAQANTYVLGSGTLTLQNVISGSTYWVALTSDLTEVLASGTAGGGDIVLTDLPLETDPSDVTIRVRKAGYIDFTTQATLSSAGASSYIIQSVDPTY